MTWRAGWPNSDGFVDRPHFGVELIPQQVTWPELRSAALEVERLGYDSLWTTDHLLQRVGSRDGSVFEAWQLLAAWAGITTRIRLGPLVTSSTLRHPGVVAKMAVTLDHITDGRAVLGLGAGNFEVEHRAFGLSYGSNRERVDRLREFVSVVRDLTMAERVGYTGTQFRLHDAISRPLPIQTALPVLIGGQGPRVMHAAAAFADVWHVVGSPQSVDPKVRAIRQECERIGRDPKSISIFVTLAPTPIVRESASDIPRWIGRVLNSYGLTDLPESTDGTEFATLVAQGQRATSAKAVLDLVEAYLDVGARGFIVVQLAPFDFETLRAIALAIDERWPR